MATEVFPQRKLRGAAAGPGEQRYFEAAAEGTLLLRQCGACGQQHHYPRSMCPFCLSDDVRWVQASGTGTVYTFSVTRRGVETPYCIAYVTLDEGVTMMTNIVDCDLDAVRIGQRVRVVFKTADNGMAMPLFTPG